MLVAMSLLDIVVVRRLPKGWLWVCLVRVCTTLPQGAMGAGANGFDTVKMLKTLRIIRIWVITSGCENLSRCEPSPFRSRCSCQGVFRVFRFFRQLTQLALMITAA